MAIKNIIFDLGAVIFDWSPKSIVENFTQDVKLQQRIQDELFFHQNWLDFDCGRVTEKQAIVIAAKQLEISNQEALRLFDSIKKSLVVLPKTEQILRVAKEKKFKVYCLSNISPEFFNHLVSQHDLFELFDGVVTSGVENVAKPDKRIFEILFERYQLEAADCLFIDDSVANTTVAKEFGVTTVTFKGSESCYQKIYRHI